MAKANDWNEVRKRVLEGDVLAFYKTNKWLKKRAAILIRDHNCCQRCLGKYKPDPSRTPRLTKATTVHHHVPLKEDFSLALVDENLVSLCFRCHEEVEGRADWQAIFKNQEKKKLTEEKW